MSAVTLLLAYRTDRLGLSEDGAEKSVARRLKPTTAVQAASGRDLGYALRLVLVAGQGFVDGQVAEVTFDGCIGKPVATRADLSCVVEGCAGGAGPVNGCTCSVRIL